MAPTPSSPSSHHISPAHFKCISKSHFGFPDRERESEYKDSPHAIHFLSQRCTNPDKKEEEKGRERRLAGGGWGQRSGFGSSFLDVWAPRPKSTTVTRTRHREETSPTREAAASALAQNECGGGKSFGSTVGEDVSLHLFSRRRRHLRHSPFR